MTLARPGRGSDAVTIVMITRDRCESARRTVERLTALPERPSVIVVDNGSSDGTVRALGEVSGVRVIAAGRNLGAAGRTLGVEQARTPCVAFADDDSWWAPGALRAAARTFDDHPRLGLLVARTLVGADERDDPINEALASAPLGRDEDLPGPTALGFLACAAVVRREAFLGVGGFHPRFAVGGEEQLLALDLLAAGWGISYVDRVVAHHYPAAGERPRRRAVMTRNELWTYWLRRRPGPAARFTRSTIAAARRDRQARRALVEAGAGLPWVLAQRRTLPADVEALARRLDDCHGSRDATPVGVPASNRHPARRRHA